MQRLSDTTTSHLTNPAKNAGISHWLWLASMWSLARWIERMSWNTKTQTATRQELTLPDCRFEKIMPSKLTLVTACARALMICVFHPSWQRRGIFGLNRIKSLDLDGVGVMALRTYPPSLLGAYFPRARPLAVDSRSPVNISLTMAIAA